MMRRMGAHVAPVLLLALIWGCGGDDGYGGSSSTSTPAQPTAAAQATGGSQGASSLISVQVADNSFSPENLTVPKGARVTWDWTGRNSHSVTGTFDGPSVESPVQKSGSFAFTFEKAGTFEYQCGVHGAAMRARVTVKE